MYQLNNKAMSGFSEQELKEIKEDFAVSSVLLHSDNKDLVNGIERIVLENSELSRKLMKVEDLLIFLNGFKHGGINDNQEFIRVDYVIGKLRGIL